MSLHYSKWQLNTYAGTPYFQAHIPADYPIFDVLGKCRAFRKLPPRVRELSALAKRWAGRVLPDAFFKEVAEWYDDEGYELNPFTGQRLTDAEIDAQWGPPDPSLANFTVVDIPAVQLANPDTWEPPPEPDESSDYDGPTEQQVRDDIKERGREYAADYYGIPTNQATTDDDLVRAVMDKMGAPTT